MVIILFRGREIDLYRMPSVRLEPAFLYKQIMADIPQAQKIGFDIARGYLSFDLDGIAVERLVNLELQLYMNVLPVLEI